MPPFIRAAFEARNPMRYTAKKRCLAHGCSAACTSFDALRMKKRAALDAQRCGLRGISASEKGFAVELFARRPAALCLKRRKALNVQRCDSHFVSALGKTRRQVVHALSHRIAPEEAHGLGRITTRLTRLPALEKKVAVRLFTRCPAVSHQKRTHGLGYATARLTRFPSLEEIFRQVVHAPLFGVLCLKKRTGTTYAAF